MGESACLMQQPFSYLSGAINEPKEGNPLRLLGESISFGRFASESLSWEKWSSFSHNRYVEEAAKYTQPGSVAQKKAFFEAHYKSIAARKAAALLEQANANANAAGNAMLKPESVGTDAVQDIPIACGLQRVVSSFDAVVDKLPQVSDPNTAGAHLTAVVSGHYSDVAVNKVEIGMVEGTDPIREGSVPLESSMKIELPANVAANVAANKVEMGKVEEMDTVRELHVFSENKNELPTNGSKNKIENGKIEGMNPARGCLVLSENCMKIELPARVGEAQNCHNVAKERKLKSSNLNREGLALMSKKKPSVSSKLRVSTAPAKAKATSHPRKENSASLVNMKLPLNKITKGTNSSHEASETMNTRKPITKLSVSGTASLIPSPPARPPAYIRPWKEGNATPVSIKSTLDSWDKKISTPKGFHKSANLTSIRGQNKLASLALQSIEGSRVAIGASRASTHYLTPLGTPATAYLNGVAKHHLTTPRSETRRARTPLHPSACGSRTTGPKWHFLTTDFSNPLVGCRNKIKSSSLSSPFSLMTEERAAKRKEKLEDRFIAREAQGVLLQSKLKEKGDTELRKLRENLCFKARPLPDFYKKRRAPKDQTKESGAAMHSQFPHVETKKNPAQFKHRPLWPRNQMGRMV